MEYEEARDRIIKELIKKSKRRRGKTKFYFSDLVKMLNMKLKNNEAKVVIDCMVEEGLLVCWSSGSANMYGLPGFVK